MDEPSSQGFEYAPLVDASLQIRLLLWERSLSAQDEIINCTMSVFDRQTAPPYVAISYTWGETGNIQHILLNGQSMMVRFNCEHALWQMRYNGIRHWLWIDSLCINQLDKDEKKLQVQDMAQTYREALYVAVCLGPADYNTQLVCHYLRRTEMYGLSYTATSSAAARAIIDSAFSTIALVDHLFKAYDTLCAKPYWTRLWVVQENVLAQHRVGFWGCDSFSVEVLRDFISASGDHGVRSLYQRVIFKWKANRSPSASLWDALLVYRDYGCADPRDKIFGLLGITDRHSELSSDLFVVDYTVSIFKLFVKLLCFEARQKDHRGKGYEWLCEACEIAESLGISSLDADAQALVRQRVHCHAPSDSKAELAL